MSTLKNILCILFIIVFTSLHMVPAIAEFGIYEVGSYDEFYAHIKNSIRSYREHLSIRINNYDKSVYDFQRTVKAIMNEEPEIYYYLGESSANVYGYVSENYRTMDIILSYSHSPYDIEKIIDVSGYTDFYNALKSAMMDFEDKVTVKILKYDEKLYDIANTIEKIADDNPGIDCGYTGAKTMLYGEGTEKIVEVDFEYDFTADEMFDMRDRTDEKINQIIKEIIKPGMNDYQKELVIHDYIVNNTRYVQDTEKDGFIKKVDHTLFGVLVKGAGICEGYAAAMKKLLNSVGIECITVTGVAKGVPHAWNMVRIGEDYYHVDVTWDDPVMDNGTNVLSHQYFNITDKKMESDHYWDKGKYPACSAVTYKFGNTVKEIKNNTVFAGNSLPELPEDDEIKVFVNGRQLLFDVNPMIVNNRTMVPMRAIFERLGAVVIWESATNSIVCNKGHRTIRLIIGSTTATVDGSPVELDAPAIAVNNRTLVSIRFIAESLGATVEWDGPTRSVNIYL